MRKAPPDVSRPRLLRAGHEQARASDGRSPRGDGSKRWTGNRILLLAAVVLLVIGLPTSLALLGRDRSVTSEPRASQEPVTADGGQERPVPEAGEVTAFVGASSQDEINVPQNTLDGNPATRWSANGDGQWIAYDLGSERFVESIEISWYEGDSRTARFTVETSVDGRNWTEVYSGESSGTTLDPESYALDATMARHVRILGHGNSRNDWTSITGVGLNGLATRVARKPEQEAVTFSGPTGAEPRVHATFDQAPIGDLTAEVLRREFETEGANVAYAEHKDLSGLSIVENPRGEGRVLHAHLPADSVGGVMNFPVVLDPDGLGYDEAYLSYRVLFGPGFDFEPDGGKLPGLAGGPSAGNENRVFPAGCEDVTGDNGFSARGMWISWREEADRQPILKQYVYHKHKEQACGDDFLYDQGPNGFSVLEPDRWYDVRHRVVMNDPGRRNGIIEAWLDGERVLRVTDLEFRNDRSWGINVLFMAGFFGGQGSRWRHDQPEAMYYDDFRVQVLDPIRGRSDPETR